MRDELLNESLFFGLDHARSAIAQWADDYNNFRPQSSLGYHPPAVYAGSIAATGAPTLRNMKTWCLRRLLPLHQLVYSKLPRLQSPLDESSVAGQRINTMHWSLGFDGKLLEQFESMDSIKGHRGLDKNPYMPESLLRSVPTSVDHSYCRYISCIGNFQRS